jgi:dipeptidyl aminopeptidase/acylaminoacyl peptidase
MNMIARRTHPPRTLPFAFLCALGIFALNFFLPFEPVVTAAEPVRLTTDGRLKQDPVFARNGADLYYVDQPTAVQLRIVRRSMEDGTTIPVHPDQTKAEYEPAVTADGRFLGFVCSRGNLSLALVLEDTVEKRQATIEPQGGFCGYRSPAFSPDAMRMLYSFADGGRQQIWSCNMKATDQKALTDSRGVNNWPNWSPDGRRIVFGSSRDDDFEIYAMNADGSDVRRLTDSSGQDTRPKFSPDGQRIAFTSNRDGNYEIYVMNADGTGVVRVTENPERDDYAAWHPDGKRLVVVSERSGRFDLYLIDAPK